MAMMTQTNRTVLRPILIALVAWVSLGVAASCSSDDQATAGGRVEHPLEPGPAVTQEPAKAPPPPSSFAPPEASTAVTSPPAVERPLSLSEKFEQSTGMKLSPVEKAIMEDCPDRAWSKNVPERRCMKDSEC